MHIGTHRQQPMTAQQYAQLMRLSSPALPVGGFSYSQGLESAVELGVINNEATTGEWIGQTLNTVMAHGEAVLWLLLYRAWRLQDRHQIHQWNQWYYASRETAEARAETTQMGVSLIHLVQALVWGQEQARSSLHDLDTPCFPTVHAYAVVALGLPEDAGLAALLYSWIENQIMAAIKTVPLGQTAGQRLLSSLIVQLDQAIATARQGAACQPPEILTLAPHYSIIAARHEHQFSRLFRS